MEEVVLRQGMVWSLLLLMLVGCASPRTGTKVRYAGVRSSEYGMVPFPSPEGWEAVVETMSRYFPGSQPGAIWIVGTVEENGNVQLEFPCDGTSYPHVDFAEEDKHEAYLRYFDTHAIKVFLQVEPGIADVDTLIALVLHRYGQHPSVIGFGVDVEWYKDIENGGIPVTDREAQEWEKLVQAHNAGFRLFLKHWDEMYMPPSYRGELVFVDDSQGFGSLQEMREEFREWAEAFYPNLVFYQIGYRVDQPWWGEIDTPPQGIGQALASVTRQECGIFWVDFTLRQVITLPK